MAGRAKIKLHHYDSKENKYAYLGVFSSQSEVFKMYYGGKKRKFIWR